MILKIKNLKTFFFTRNETVKAVNNITLNIAQGEIHGIAGESGSGKSVMGLSIMKLLQHPGKIVEGNIIYKDDDLTKISEKKMSSIRGNEISMIFQDATMSLNPILNIKTQMIEAILAHNNINKNEAKHICRRERVNVHKTNLDFFV